ncbi:unnamed protein product [Rangifer tarandus platyrhynchus]|uniref:Uncharacterized protein n=1 Tax=Rangifer tarandus platyrhynchus TaxID=3082113 RepID=A0AC59YEZ5_RANTA
MQSGGGSSGPAQHVEACRRVAWHRPSHQAGCASAKNTLLYIVPTVKIPQKCLRPFASVSLQSPDLDRVQWCGQ